MGHRVSGLEVCSNNMLIESAKTKGEGKRANEAANNSCCLMDAYAREDTGRESYTREFEAFPVGRDADKAPRRLLVSVTDRNGLPCTMPDKKAWRRAAHFSLPATRLRLVRYAGMPMPAREQ